MYTWLVCNQQANRGITLPPPHLQQRFDPAILFRPPKRSQNDSMDPGTAIGVVSLAFQLLGGCIKGIVILSEARNAGKVSSSLLCLLGIQELRLTEWAKRAGLLGPQGVLDRRLNAVVVESVLFQLSNILGDVEKLSRRYNLRLIEVRPEDAGKREGDDHARVLGVAISNETRRDILWRSKQIQDRNTLPKRLWFVAFDRDKFKEMVAEVRIYVQELWSLLDPLTQDDMLHQQRLVLSRVIRLTEKIDDVRALSEALGSKTIPAGDDNGPMPLANIVAVKAAILGIESSSKAVKSPDEDKIVENVQPLREISQNQLLDFAPLNAPGDVGLATFEGQKCFVEHKAISSESRWKLLKRVQHLAQVLHVPKDSRFRSLHCIGLSIEDDASRVAFVFQLPALTAQHTMSLKDILSGAKGPKAPSVSARMDLSIQIAQSIRYFHTVGWMHKNLRSENVRFFAEDASRFLEGGESILADPVLTGFLFARLDAPGEVTDKPSVEPARDIYRHPGALDGAAARYQPFMDLYSLGTVLMEIAEWRPLSTLVKQVIDVKRVAIAPLTQLAEVKTWLSAAACGEKDVVKVDFRMGKKYARAVRMCLGVDHLDGDMVTTNLGAEAQKDQTAQVLDEVIKELRGCII